MTDAERLVEDRRARLMAELDDGSCVSAGGLYAKLRNVPPPDLEGLTPAEIEVAVVKWIDAVERWEREGAQPFVPQPAPTAPHPTKAPVA